MNVFGEDYIAHNFPLLFLSGLRETENSLSNTGRQPQDGGFRIRTDLPAVDNSLADLVSKAIYEHDGAKGPWRASPTSARLFTVRNVGRSFTLPPHKAPPPPHSPRLTTIGNGPPPSLVLHSPLSPLTPSSFLYPDGILDQQWITKHQHYLPSAVAMVLPLTADPNTSSLLDNKLRAEINGVKSALLSANYKTRLVVMLLGDEVIAPAEVEERVGTIRKTTSLDLRGLCFMPSDSSPEQVTETVNNLLNALHPQCVEYYRDLSKHARRKRNRNATPQPTIPPTTAHVLSSQGWVVRYEFKLAVFAEFRQEMDAASRNYESAYEALFTPEVIESIASWSPRFNQARLLADVIALRILRCLLWTGQHTTAVKVWNSHRERVAGLLDRRGKGTETYGWEAWQSTWSKTMADLLTRAEVSGLQKSIFLSSEPNSAIADRPSPLDQVHHQGYWLRKAYKHAKQRRDRAAAIPEEDRQPLEKATAAKMSNAAQKYDTYLVSSPYVEASPVAEGGFDHEADILRCIETAREHFVRHDQSRVEELILFDRAGEHLQSKSWLDAIEVLQPLWEKSSWRRAGWWHLLESIGLILLDCAQKVGNAELILRITWELANSSFSPRNGIIYDLDDAISNCKIEEPLSVVFTAQDTACRIVSSFAFSSVEGHVGDAIDCQLVLTSPIARESRALALSQVKVAFEGALKPIQLTHTDSGAEATSLATVSSDVYLEDSTQLTQANKRASASALPSTTGQTDLTIGPQQTRIFNFSVTPREAGDLSVASLTLLIEQEKYNITVINTEIDQGDSVWWETKAGELQPREIGVQRAVTTLHVLPKPPKVEISAVNFKKSYYTNEQVPIDLLIVNSEEEAVISTINVRMISPIAEAALARWVDQGSDEETQLRDMEQSLPTRALETLAAGASEKLSLSISETAAAIDHELEIGIEYYMESDPDTKLQKSLTLDVAIIRPFEANYDFTPKGTIDAWPSYFERPPIGFDTPSGLTQTFSVAANLFSFALEPVVIEAILLTTTSITGGAVCSSTTGMLKEAASNEEADKISTSISPEETKTFNFDLTIQKIVLGDRDTVSLDLALEIGWRRPSSDTVNSTILEVPRFVNPMAEPRVLLTVDSRASAPGQEDMQLITLRYTVENPSMHFLTFNVAMEASEEFAFSGPKAGSVSLVPISKVEVVYRILPIRRDTESSRERKKERDKKGDWLRVQLNVVDAYFNQTLRVQPAGEGVKLDRRGGVVVLVD